MQCIPLNSATATFDYCRQARRIRASFNRSPSLRQHALSRLADQRNAQTRNVTVRQLQPTFEVSASATIERGFAEHAAEKLQPFGFTYSDRIDLLNSAERIGISRFRANMILALHEHRAGTANATKDFAKPAATSPIAPSFLVILSLEILVVGLIAWAFMQ